MMYNNGLNNHALKKMRGKVFFDTVSKKTNTNIFEELNHNTHITYKFKVNAEDVNTSNPTDVIVDGAVISREVPGHITFKHEKVPSKYDSANNFVPIFTYNIGGRTFKIAYTLFRETGELHGNYEVNGTSSSGNPVKGISNDDGFFIYEAWYLWKRILF